MFVVSGYSACGRRSFLIVTADRSGWVPWILARGVVRWEVRSNGELVEVGSATEAMMPALRVNEAPIRLLCSNSLRFGGAL